MPRVQTRRLRALVGHVAATEQPPLGPSAAGPKHPPLGSLEGDQPALRSWTVAQLGTEGAAPNPDGTFPEPLHDEHPAVQQFREWGYVALLDAVAP